MQFVKLNAFQRIMRLWDRVHPYNAAQAFRLEGDADLDRIADAWRATLKGMGVGRIIGRDDAYCHTAPDDRDPRALPQTPSPGTTIDAHLSAEMNVAINPNDDCPFRAFVLRESGSHCVGVTYHHWAADSFSIRWLLSEWFKRMRDPHHVIPRPVRIASSGYWHLFGPHVAGWGVDEAVLGLLRYRTRFCRARRIECPMGDCRVQISLHHAPDGIVPVLAARAHECGVTLNDVLLSTIAQAVDQFGANPNTPGRDELSFGTVVDLRSSANRNMDDLFGLFLGFTTTVLRPADLRNWPRLLRTVSLQNAWHKQTKAPQTSVLRMGVGLAEARLVTPRRWAELYRERMPIAAGISNVNMNRTWAGEQHPSPLLDYFRVAPTGPMLPLLFTPTTLGKKLNFLITRQTSIIDESRCAQIAESITQRLLELAENAGTWDNPRIA